MAIDSFLVAYIAVSVILILFFTSVCIYVFKSLSATPVCCVTVSTNDHTESLIDGQKPMIIENVQIPSILDKGHNRNSTEASIHSGSTEEAENTTFLEDPRQQACTREPQNPIFLMELTAPNLIEDEDSSTPEANKESSIYNKEALNIDIAQNDHTREEAQYLSINEAQSDYSQEETQNSTEAQIDDQSHAETQDSPETNDRPSSDKPKDPEFLEITEV